MLGGQASMEFSCFLNPNFNLSFWCNKLRQSRRLFAVAAGAVTVERTRSFTRFLSLSIHARRQTTHKARISKRGYYGIIMMVRRERGKKKDSTRSSAQRGKLVFPVPLFTIRTWNLLTTKSLKFSISSCLLLFFFPLSLLLAYCQLHHHKVLEKALYCFMSWAAGGWRLF